MAFLDLHFYSPSLQKQVSAYALVPEGKPGPWPVFYLLHGMSDDHTIWMRRTRIDLYAADSPFMIVMPDGGRGFYTNADQGPKWGDFITQDLPDFVERTFRVRADRGGRCIGGLSMGGYGAIRCALSRPDRYVSANSFSGAMKFTQVKRGVLKETEWRLVFGRNPTGSDHDLIHLARQAKKARKLPAMRIDCGTADFLIEENRLFHRELAAEKIAHEYEEFPGEHNWDYWEAHIREALAFHGRHVTKAPAAARR